jgi:transcription initiation factor TFIIIB Brf1 subunit/transcription initiation factor TFIIB
VEVQNVKNTNKAKKMATAELLNFVVCCFCGKEIDKRSFDATDSVQSCPDCGSVLAEEQVFTYESGNTNSSSSFSEYSQAFQTRKLDYEARKWEQKLHPKHAERRKLELKRRASRICEQLQLSKEITEQILDFLIEKANRAFLHMKKKVRLVGACIYIICRNSQLPITLKQVSVVCNCTVFEVGCVVKLVDTKFNLYQTPVTTESLITTACSDLPRQNECEELARSLCRCCSKSMVLIGTPVPQAIAYSVLASLALNKGTTQKDEIKKLCLKMAQVSEGTVLQHLKSLRNYILTLLQAIPWVDMKYVKLANIHYYIKDVLNYEKDCGKFPAKVADPPWCHERESEILARKVKIQNALERVRRRQSLAASASAVKENSLADSVTNEESSSSNLSKLVGKEGNVSTELNSSVSFDPLPNTDSEESVYSLDDEDKVIEELIEMGCTAEQLQEGFYENLKLTSSPLSHEIDDPEIESYIRNPDEVSKLKRMADSDRDFGFTGDIPKKKRRRKEGVIENHEMWRSLTH